MMALPPTLRSALSLTKDIWDVDTTRQVVRDEFHKDLACRTLLLGADVFASATGEALTVPHTCKSRACPSCGHRANRQWLREHLADLPDVPCWHVVLTMPDVLWTIFKVNRDLLHDLADLAANAIRRWLRMTYGVEPLIVAIPHTFGYGLKFKCHVHLLVSQGGLDQSSSWWRRAPTLDRESIMHMWRYAVITLLRDAHRRGLLATDLGRGEFASLLESQYDRWWHVWHEGLADKRRVLNYAGRYMKHPPLAERKILEVSEDGVRILAKDHKAHKTVELTLSQAEFVERLSHHVPDRYHHGVRYFGLLAPRCKGRLHDFLFHVLGQAPKERPRHLTWRYSINVSFGVDPLLDSKGQPMRRVARIAATRGPQEGRRRPVPTSSLAAPGPGRDWLSAPYLPQASRLIAAFRESNSTKEKGEIRCPTSAAAPSAP
ncbi:MAG: transposase [Dehalococcoidales bacterium]|nr:transposase [Dehalococcoidales bacterium]